MSKIFKMVSVLAIISMLASLFGCKSNKEYTSQDIEALSISCGETDLRNSYSFGLSLNEGKWIFYADCFSLDGETEIKLETPIKNEEAEKLLTKAEESGFITSLQKYKKPLFNFSFADEAIYSSRITFSDGNTLSAPILASREMETLFYILAEEYGKNY